MRLGTLLLRDAVISLSQLEAALRAQVIYGGRLGTNLVELGFVELDTLAAYLARVLELPQATAEHFENAPAEALDALGSGLADVYTAVPIGFENDDSEPDSSRVLAVALAEPKSERVVEKLQVQTGMEVRPYCAPELRLYYYLEKHYQLARKARFVRTQTIEDAGSWADRRRIRAPEGDQQPPSVRPGTGAGEDRAGSVRPRRMEHDEAVRRIERTSSREVVGETVIEFAAGRFGAAVLFLLRDDSAIGWRVSSEDSLMDASVEELSLGLAAESVLQRARDQREVYRGSSPAHEQPVERRLWEALGLSSAPAEMLVAPIIVSDQVIHLLYLHPLPGAGFDEQAVEEMLDLCQHASAGYARMIERTKQMRRD